MECWDSALSPELESLDLDDKRESPEAVRNIDSDMADQADMGSFVEKIEPGSVLHRLRSWTLVSTSSISEIKAPWHAHKAAAWC